MNGASGIAPMTPRITARQAFALSAAAAALAFGPVAEAAEADAATTVYKCAQASGTVLYADYPCKGGVVVEIKPDAADPDAIERLRRAQEAFDRSMARRNADEERATQRREALEQRRREMEAAQSLVQAATDEAYPGYLPAYGYAVPYPRRRAFDTHRHKTHRYVAAPGRVPASIRRPQRN